MDGRRASLGGRQARKEAASPYARPASPAPRATPSRLSSVLSYLSPFRKSKQREPEPEPESESESEENEQDDEQQEEGQFALHGQALAHVGDATFNEHEQRAPPSPTPHGQSLYPSLSSLSASHSMPNLASQAASPRFPGNFAPSPLGIQPSRQATPSAWGGSESQFEGAAHSPPAGRATEELARFFREKADRGDEPLTAVEQAGVFALMQQAQAETLPTAFTPHFARGSPSNQSFAPQSALSASTSTARFGSPAPTGTPSTAFRRRRPIYVGAGYSSQSARRRKTNAAALGSDGGLTRSQSVGMVYEMSGSKSREPSVADGKRRKVVEDDDDAPPTFALEQSLPASPAKSVAASPAKASTSLAPKPAVISTPARPSPLWQVSQADTPSPSPPQKSTSSAPARPPTRAADIMMDIIREEDAARPKVTRQEVLNPYESADNPMARIPRSRPARPATPHRAPASAKKAAPAPAKEISALEQLERTMPAEYRRDDGKRARPSPASPAKTAPAPAPKATQAKAAPAPKKAAVDVIELSDSDEDEDEEMEDDEEEEEEEETPPPVKQTAVKSKASTKQSSTFAPAQTSQKAPSPAPPTPKRKAASPEPTAPQPPSLFAPAAQQPASPRATLPPASTPAAPSAPFTFSVPPAVAAASAPAPSTSTAEISEEDARKSALQLSKSSLPKFSFIGAFAGCESKKEEDATLRGVQDLVKAMGRSELPSIAL